MPSDTGTPSSPFLERKLATILSADVAEFSRLMSEDEEQTLRTFRGHKKIFEALVANHGGRVFNTAGDAILAEFPSAVEAVRCATDIQSALRTRNDQLSPNRQVRFRIGINLGDVMVQGQDLLGDGVNVAARLQTAAEPGGICIAGSVHDQIRNKLSMTFQSLGERNYKNIAQPVRTFSVLETESGAPLPSAKPAATRNRVPVAAGALALIVLLCGGGYWAYTRYASGTSSQSQAIAPVPQRQAGEASRALPVATESPANAVQPNDANPAAAPKPAESTHKSAPAAAKSPGLQANTPAKASSSLAVAAGPFDGAFDGQVCFEETSSEARRCFHGGGTVAGEHITGQWPMGKDTGITMFLNGYVSSEGNVKMEMHSEKADGSRIHTIEFTGSIHDAFLDAHGNFLMGRPANLHWHRSTQVPATN